MTTVNGVGNGSTTPKVVAAKDVGFAGLTSDDFLNLLIAQLQNQDPTNPMDSDQMLAQISEMRGLQASIELESALASLTLSQQLTSSTSFLGKTISGNIGQDVVQGVVDGVQVRDGKSFLRVNGRDVELKNVTAVTS
jgi:flagellar basal-body rod modification protein FlgD